MADGCNLVITCEVEDAAQTLEWITRFQEEAARIAAQLGGDLGGQGDDHG